MKGPCTVCLGNSEKTWRKKWRNSLTMRLKKKSKELCKMCLTWIDPGSGRIMRRTSRKLKLSNWPKISWRLSHSWSSSSKDSEMSSPLLYKQRLTKWSKRTSLISIESESSSAIEAKSEQFWIKSILIRSWTISRPKRKLNMLEFTGNLPTKPMVSSLTQSEAKSKIRTLTLC